MKGTDGSQSRNLQQGAQTDKLSSRGVMAHEDKEANDLLADDLHAKKSLSREAVDRASSLRNEKSRVSISDPKNGPQD